MIQEKLTELLLLERILTQSQGSTAVKFNNKEYDMKKADERFGELLEEFLEPYVINSTSKE